MGKKIICKPESGISRKSLQITFFLLALFSTFIFFSKVFAVPAYDRPFELKQPSGKTFEARQRGDEWYNWVETKDGFGIYKNTITGNWEYYVPSDKAIKKEPKFRVGVMQDTKERAIVGEVDPASLGIPKGLRPFRTEEKKPKKPDLKQSISPQVSPHPSPLSQDERDTSFLQKEYAENDLLRKTKKSSKSTAVSGTMHLLVIGVDYEDTPATYTAEQIQPLVFGANSSVSDYYSEVSYSAVTISPAVESQGTSNDGFIGWLRLSGNHPNPEQYADSNTKWTTSSTFRK